MCSKLNPSMPSIWIILALIGLVILVRGDNRPIDLNKIPTGVAEQNNVIVEENKCLDSCPDVYDPICTFNGKCFKTFNNPCEVLRANCDKLWYNSFNITDPSPCSANKKPNCDICPEQCIKESKPICGYNKFCYETFYSECHMRKRDCNSGGIHMFEQFAEGKCPNEQLPSCDEFCPIQCPQILTPVCGKKQNCYQSFYNECYLERTNCVLPDGNPEFDFVHIGNCLPQEMLISKGC